MSPRDLRRLKREPPAWGVMYSGESDTKAARDGPLYRLYVCENCGRLGPMEAFQDDCRPGWTHGRLIRVTTATPGGSRTDLPGQNYSRRRRQWFRPITGLGLGAVLSTAFLVPYAYSVNHHKIPWATIACGCYGVVLLVVGTVRR